MNPLPIYEDDNYIDTGKLKEKVALVTGGTAELDELYPLLMRKEGADVISFTKRT